MVEFALVVPILAFLLFAIIQWGLIFNAYINVRHAANVTARTAALTGASTNTASLKTVATGALFPPLKSANLSDPQLSNVTIATANDAYQVTLNYTLPVFISWVVPASSGGTMTVTGSAVYRKN